MTLLKKSNLLTSDRKHSIEYWLSRQENAKRGGNLFVELIKESYEEDYGDLWGIFASPSSPRKRGIGKSVFAIKLLLHVYRDWEIAKRYIFYKPQDFIRLFEHLVDNREKIPLAVWDDAGAWLFRGRFMQRFALAVAEHLEVIRTHITTMVFTATSYGKLLKGVRESLGFIVLVRVIGSREIDGRRFKVSEARLYEASEDATWLFNRKRAPEVLASWKYLVKLPEEIYRDYQAMRESYVQAGVEKVKAELERLAGELGEIAGKAEAPPEALAEDLDLDDLREMWGY